MLDELDDEIMDFDSNIANSDVEKVDSILIKKILSEMKCEFNRTTNNPKPTCTTEPDDVSVGVSHCVGNSENEGATIEVVPPDTEVNQNDVDHEEDGNEEDLNLNDEDGLLNEEMETQNDDGDAQNEEEVAQSNDEVQSNEAHSNYEAQSNDEAQSNEAQSNDEAQSNEQQSNDEPLSNDEAQSNDETQVIDEAQDEKELSQNGEDEAQKEEEKVQLENPETSNLKTIDNYGDEDTVESYQTSEGIEPIANGDSAVKISEAEPVENTNETIDEDCGNDALTNKAVEESGSQVAESNPSTPAEPEDLVDSKKSPRVSRNSGVGVKRSSRRMSKENSRESVLQSAIALKEKSFSSLQNDDKPQRRSSRLVDGERVLSIRLRHRSSRLAADTYDITNSNSESRKSYINPAGVNKTHRYSTEEDIDDSKCASTTSFSSDYKLSGDFDDSFEPKLQDSGSSESVVVNEISPKAKKRRKRGPVPGSKRKKLVSSTNEKSKESVNFCAQEQEIYEPIQCECRVITSLYVRSKEDELQFCTGVDSIEKRAVGCDNMADTTFPLVRPLSRVPFQSLCSIHIDRILRHNCCPLCGVFCTRGMFMYCKSNHFYHKDCDLFYDNYTVCPHCGRNETKEVTLSLAHSNNPFFLPSQKVFDKSISARITAMPLKKLNQDGPEESDLGATPNLILPSGVELKIAGAPALERELLKKCLTAFSLKNSDSNSRFTNRNLFQAAKIGDVEKVIHILWSGLSPNLLMKEGTPLHAACRNGHLAMVHILIQAGASIDALDKEQYTPLMLSCQQGFSEIVKYLIGAGAERTFKGAGGMTALHVAAKEGHVDCCFYLLSNTSSPSGIVDALDEGNWTSLVWAAENKQIDVVRFLIRKKANIHLRDTERNTSVHWAALAGSFEILEDLLNEGSDMNATNIYGDTPLHIAAREGSTECVMLLLSRGAIPDMVNKAAMVPRECCRTPNPFIYDLISVSMKFAIVTANIPIFPRLLVNDISRGKELNPIQCVNEVDDEGIPTDFTYVTENCFTTNVQVDTRITSLIPCKCEDTCTATTCVCTLNSKGCWYDITGKLVPDFNYEDPPLVFECNPACQCNSLTCVNRVVQKGIRIHLQMYKTRTKNWGVITLGDIPKGTYVCEYIGEIISDSEADTRQDDSYLFDLDNKEKESYCIDARWYGNITRFINHSCKPNLFPVRVFINHHDLRFPRIAFFAAKDIPAQEELGFDYGEKFWMIKYKTFTCTCGADNCRYSDQTIQQTVIKYNESLKLEEQQVLAN